MNATCNKSVYAPRGAAREIFTDKSREILFSGAVRTGKSLALLNKLYVLAWRYPGMRGLIVRKTRASLTETGLVTWETEVVPQGSALLSGASRQTRQSYLFPNGSTVVIGGMDKAEKIMSSQYDFVFVQEATELDETDWEALTTRLSHGVTPYQQICGDCNPSSPTHWLKLRESKGILKIHQSRFEDNPRFYDSVGVITDFGREYLDGLKRSLSGVRFERLYLGQWAASEGMVYQDAWDRQAHIIDRFDIPTGWARYWSIDFGYTNPFVWQCWAQDGDGRLYLYREIYRTQRLVEDHAKRILELTAREPKPLAVVCDHDAEGRATLERYLGMRTTPAHKAVSDGIQAVAARLRRAGDDKPRLFFMRDSLDERDAALDEQKKPASTIEEFESYVWNTASGRRGEEPVKAHDHAMDAMRYMVAHHDLNQRRAIKFY